MPLINRHARDNQARAINGQANIAANAYDT
jgi:hypothetical protein